MLYRFSEHLYSSWYSQHSLLDINQFFYTFMAYFELGGSTEILIVILIPLYLCLLRPFIHRYIPGMLKRIGLGMIIRLLSLLSVFIIDTIGHTQILSVSLNNIYGTMKMRNTNLALVCGFSYFPTSSML